MRRFRYYDRLGQAHWLDWNDPGDQLLLARLWDADYRRVAYTEVGGVRVSTVFLPLDHGFRWDEDDDDYRPLIYETMVFGASLDQEGWRYSTEAEAIDGHQRAVALVRLDQAATTKGTDDGATPGGAGGAGTGLGRGTRGEVSGNGLDDSQTR